MKPGKAVSTGAFVVLLISTPLAAGAADPLNIEQLVKPAMVTDIKIAPDGEHLAVRVFRDGRYALLFMDRKTHQVTGGFGGTASGEVGDFDWVNDKRVVGKVLQVSAVEEAPVYYGELFATNFDGSAARMLYGYRSAERQTDTHIAKQDSDNGWAEIIDLLPADDRHILISSTHWSASMSGASELRVLDVYSGRDKPVFAPPGRIVGQYLTDSHGDVRVIASVDDDYVQHVQTLPFGGEWGELSGTAYGDAFLPVLMTDGAEAMYVVDNPSGDLDGLYEEALDGTHRKAIYEHPKVDVTDVLLSTEPRRVYALRFDDGYPSYVILSDETAEAAAFRQMLHTFAGYLVSMESGSRDGRFWIVKTRTDRDEGSYYLFDRSKNQVQLLFASRPDVRVEQLSPTKPVAFASFDGRSISGYFTPAFTDLDPTAGAGGDPPPMVVLVHGGPRARDSWGYDPIVQVLATRGYSVLQLNYRGSTGYGSKFLHLGDRQWGNDVQKDIIAGTRWAVSQGMAKAGRVCIMGASFGAYSAVMSAELAPDLYACVVANAGIYDLPLLYQRGDVQSLYLGDAYLEEAVGRDGDELRRYSPAGHVDRLRAPVFIAHGRQDPRAPFAHALRLKRALDEHHKPYEWFVRRREGHGFYDTDNQVTYLKAVVAFLDKYLASTSAQ